MIVSLCVALVTTASAASALTGEDILHRIDDNRDYETFVATGRMEIHIEEKVRVKTMEITSMTEGSRSIVEFTNPADKGTRYLMRDENLWIYFPEEQDVVKISGHMLKEGMMGSDVSYEDALETDLLSGKYDITRQGDETCEGHECYVVALDATTRDAPYYKRKMWVDTETFVVWKEQMYAKSGKLLKTARVLDVKKIEGRWMPVESEMVNELRRTSRTVFSLSDIKLGVPLDPDQFTMRYLRR